MFNWSVLSIVEVLVLARGSDMKIIQMEQCFGFSSSSGVRLLDISELSIWVETLRFWHFPNLLTRKCEDTSTQFQ